MLPICLQGCNYILGMGIISQFLYSSMPASLYFPVNSFYSATGSYSMFFFSCERCMSSRHVDLRREEETHFETFSFHILPGTPCIFWCARCFCNCFRSAACDFIPLSSCV